MAASSAEEEKKLKLLWGNILQQTDTDENDAGDGRTSSSRNGPPGAAPGGAGSSSINLMAAARNPVPANVTQSREELARAYTWDMVVVFNVGDEDKQVKVWDADAGQTVTMSQAQHFQNCTADIVDRLQQAGLYTSMWYSVQRDEIYCKVSASELRLQREADRVDYDLQLDHQKCLEYGRALGVKLAEYTARDDVDNIKEDAWMNIYGHYNQLEPDRAFRQELYVRYNTADADHPRYNSFFRSTDRIKLTVSIAEADTEIGGAGISFSRLAGQDDHSMLAFFPLHEHEERDELMGTWTSLRAAFVAPLTGIRNYYGESIAIYFAFLSFYNRELVLPAIIGLGFFIYQIIDGRVDVAPIPLYALYVSLWSTMFLEKWKREEAKMRIRWGMTAFLSKEQPRPEFSGEWKPSPVDGKKIEVFPLRERLIRAAASQGVVWTLILLVIASVAGTFLFRTILVEWNQEFGGIITAVINAVLIMIFNAIYGKVSFMLTDWENHRTDTEYENALISKTFLFKFVNSYNSLFYMAFVKRHDSFARRDGDETGCLNDDCLSELRQQLGTIFITMIVINNLVEVVTPVIMAKIADRQNRADPSVFDEVPRVKSEPENEFELAPYDSTFDDFDELVIQYGYVTLFVVAFPLAPLLALINNLLEVRVDSFKVCRASRRPEPRGAANIGTWYGILEIMSFIAVIVNVALIAFASPVTDDWFDTAEAKAYAFIATEHFIFIVKFAIAYFVPDEPEEYHTHLARQNYIVNVLLLGMEEEEEDEMEEGIVSGKKEFDWSAVAETMPETKHDI